MLTIYGAAKWLLLLGVLFWQLVVISVVSQRVKIENVILMFAF